MCKCPFFSAKYEPDGKCYQVSLYFREKDGINTTFVCRYHIEETNTVSHARPEISEKKCWRGVPIVFFLCMPASLLHVRLARPN